MEAEYPPCPLCGRPMVPGPSVNRHHLIPKLKGGKQAFDVHRICHSKVHSLWTEAELRDYFHTWERIRADERMQVFIRWVQKQPAEYVARNAKSADHRRPRRRRR
ncbi:MAG: HNH endonuclease [Myxococcota bacterium]